MRLPAETAGAFISSVYAVTVTILAPGIAVLAEGVGRLALGVSVVLAWTLAGENGSPADGSESTATI